METKDKNVLAEGSSEENRQEPIDEGTISLREDVVATDLKKDETKIFREVIKQSVGASNGEGRGASSELHPSRHPVTQLPDSNYDGKPEKLSISPKTTIHGIDSREITTEHLDPH